MATKVTLIRGDGIGPAVTDAAVRCIEATGCSGPAKVRVALPRLKCLPRQWFSLAPDPLRHSFFQEAFHAGHEA